MPDRFTVTPGQPSMQAMVTMGHGGFDKLAWRTVPMPRPGPGEVLLQVLAAGMNNTEINTRLGWYSESVTTDTAAAAQAQEQKAGDRADGGWNAPTPFPFIQGTDCCGRVVAVGAGVDAARIGERVLVRACMRRSGFGSLDCDWMGSDFDGAFAQFVKVPSAEAFAMHCDWSDAELASIPCAYATAENMLHRAGVAAGQRVLIAGASGGVGSAAVQLALRRGAHVSAIAGRAKMQALRELGAHQVLERDSDRVHALGQETVDLVVDNVAGAGFGAMLKVLRRGGTYVTSGAIAGPVVALDMRNLYLKDLRLLGCTAWDEPVFPNLVAYIERGEIKPLVAKTFPLERMADAQREFMEKRHVGNFVLLPPALH